MSQWYLAYDNQQIGPISRAEALQQVAKNPNGHVWREGFVEWLPMAQVGELQGGAAVPPPRTTRAADDIDFRIVGSEMQFVEVELDPGESVVAEAGAMMYKSASVVMESVFGDGSGAAAAASTALMDKLVGAGKRLLTGESLFVTVFTNSGSVKAQVAFAAPYPGNIIPVTLKNFGGSLICQKESFLCAARGVSIGIFFQRKILTGLFGGEGFIMQKLDGDGLVFLHAGGTIVERTLATGETLHADSGCVVAFEPSVTFDVQQAGSVKTVLFGGEGLFLATLQGPGRVWLQSLPFSRLAGRLTSPRAAGREEGSLLGGILQGDRY